MKNSLLNLIAFLLIFFAAEEKAFAQDYYNPDALIDPPAPKTFLGIASGLENFTGLLGPSIEANVWGGFGVYAGVGLGSWGYKMSGGLKYYTDYPYGWAWCLSVSHATGLRDFETELETRNGQQMVRLDLLPCQTLNLTAQHHWKLGKKNRFNLEFGYSIPLTYDAYTVKDGSVLTDTSELALKILQPGGLMFGIGFTFGL